jgi:ssDNA-binding Zn-finger/Zn-ribbon topoisomerase 1
MDEAKNQVADTFNPCPKCGSNLDRGVCPSCYYDEWQTVGFIKIKQYVTDILGHNNLTCPACGHNFTVKVEKAE